MRVVFVFADPDTPAHTVKERFLEWLARKTIHPLVFVPADDRCNPLAVALEKRVYG